MKFLRVVASFSLLVCVVQAVLADAPVDGRAGRAELRFMQGMIDHHQMAIDMADDCLARTDISDALRAECQAIVETQQPEIVQMQVWLLDWYNVQYAPVSMMATMAMTDDGMADHSGHSMPGMPATDPAMMMGMMAGLNRVQGVEYEITWLEAMIDHHDDAVHMSARLLERDSTTAAHTALRELAQTIINAQSEEVIRYETMLSAFSA